MKKGRIALLDKPFGRFMIEEIPVPAAKKGELVVKQVMCGVCGTDAHMYQGRLPGTVYPIVLGHETVGTVEEIGEGLESDFGGRPIKKGDLVYVVPAITCGKCYFCTVAKEPSLCVNITGVGFNPTPENPRSFHGGYADFIYLDHPRQPFFKIEAQPEAAVFLEPLTVGIHIASRVRICVGQTVVVQGAGAVGLAALIAAKNSGAYKTIVIGAPEVRLKLAERYGADLTINIDEVKDSEKRIDIVRSEATSGYGADIVLECTGNPKAIPEGIKMLRRAGTYVVAGHFTDAGPVSLNPFADFNNKHISLVGVWGADVGHFIQGLPIIESGKYPLGDLVTHKLPLERCEDAMKAIIGGYRLDGKEVGKAVIASSL